mmetsp:Transcript_23989/g.54589  ORF Transcript_23989/g.54589 Transcript_23989/m.54589 type:complete len:84 (-) Transcript_23989:198-449(-)
MPSIDMWLHTKIVGSCSSSSAVSSDTTKSTKAKGIILYVGKLPQNFPALKENISHHVVSMAPNLNSDMGRAKHMEAIKEHIAA